MKHHLFDTLAQLQTPDLSIGMSNLETQSPSALFVAKLPDSFLHGCSYSFRLGLFSSHAALIPLFFFTFKNQTQTILLETSLNAYNEQFHGFQVIRRLQAQTHYALLFCNQHNQLIHKIHFTNTHHAFYRQTVHLIESRAPWTTTMFHRAQQHIVQYWPTAEERLHQLAKP